MAASSSRNVLQLGKRAFHSSSRQLDSREVLKRHAVAVGPTQLSRLEEYYNQTLASDLMYMAYQHTSSSGAGLEEVERSEALESEAMVHSGQRTWDPASPYSKNRPSRPNRGNRMIIPWSSKYEEEVVKLEKIYVTAFCKDAIGNKQALIPLLAQMRAITGKPIVESLADPTAVSASEYPKTGHVKIIRSKSGAASFKLRPGMPVGVQAVLPSKSAYEFLEIFINFVLPRLRSFNGFLLPPSNQPKTSPAAVSGVVSLGMRPDALGLFPQLEVNWDSYTNRPVGFQIDCVTNMRGKGASDKARQLLSGFGIPFVRRSDQ